MLGIKCRFSVGSIFHITAKFDFTGDIAYIVQASQGALFFSGPATDTLEN